MNQIHKDSDFKIIEKWLRNTPVAPFKYTYSVPRSDVKYEVSYDGTNFTNCKILDDGTIMILFKNPGFQPGRLKVERQYFLTDEDFADGKCNLITNDDCDISITSGQGTKVVNMDVMSPYVKGDPGDAGEPGKPGKDLLYSSLTEEEKELLKTPIEIIDCGTA